MKTPAKRVRPADGGIEWRDELHAFECLGGCEDFFQVAKRADRENPETMLYLKEMLIADHTECWEFDDPEMVREARRYRSERKRRENLRNLGRGPGIVDCSGYLRRGR
jgi:hypothetical protein